MKPHLEKLAADNSSHQVATVLAGLLHAATEDKITGLVFGVTFRGHTSKVLCDAAGTLWRDPVKGIGVASLVRHYLEEVIHTSARDSTL